MGLTKNYLLTVLENCSEENFGQDAVEWAIVAGHVALTGDLQTDLKTIMGPVADGLPDETNYDRIIVAYRKARANLHDQTMDALHPLFAEILRPLVPPLPKAMVEV